MFNILDLNYIYSFILFILLRSDYQMICTTVNYWSVFCFISFKVLYFNKFILLSAVLQLTGNTSEPIFFVDL